MRGKPLYIIGKKFNRLTVLKKCDSINKASMFLCRCDCGNERIIAGSSLITGNTKSCGCLAKELKQRGMDQLPAGGAGLNWIFYNYRHHAKSRGLEFNLSREEFEEMVKLPCFYCGKEPSSRAIRSSDHGTFVYNGIDRLDNSKSYDKLNCRTSCERCNRMKMDNNLDFFIDNITKIYNHLLAGDSQCPT